jgi:hypothetical protein
LVGALVDFETVLSIPPTPQTSQVLLHDEALRQRDIVVAVLGCSYTDLASAHAKEIATYNEPPYTEQAPSPGEKDTLDEPLPTTCRFYNHSGCRRGKKCLFSHAPDTRSVRDDRGRNVCLYYLIGKCKWNMFTCIYSHSKDHLPDEYKVDDTSRPSWWNDPLRREAVRELVEQRDVQRKKLHERYEFARQRNGNRKPKKKKNKDGKEEAEKAEKHDEHRPPESSNGDESLIIDWESESEDEPTDELEEEFEEMHLQPYGVKPWKHEEAEELVVALAS